MEDMQDDLKRSYTVGLNSIKLNLKLDKNYIFPGSKLTGTIILTKNKYILPLDILTKDKKFFEPIKINFCIEQQTFYYCQKKEKYCKNNIVLNHTKEYTEVINMEFDEKIEFPFELTIPENLYPSINIFNSIINQYVLITSSTFLEKSEKTIIFIKNSRTYPKRKLLKEPCSKFKEEKMKYSIFGFKDELDVLFNISSNSIPYNKNIDYEIIIDERKDNLQVECIKVSLFRTVKLNKIEDDGKIINVNQIKNEIANDKITNFNNLTKKGEKIYIKKEFVIPREVIRENNNNYYNENMVESNENIYPYCEGGIIEIKYEIGINVKILSHIIEIFIPFEIYFNDIIIDIPPKNNMNVSRLDTEYSSKMLNDSLSSNSMIESISNPNLNKKEITYISAYNVTNLNDIDNLKKEMKNKDDNNNKNIDVPDGYELLDENQIYELMKPNKG